VIGIGDHLRVQAELSTVAAHWRITLPLLFRFASFHSFSATPRASFTYAVDHPQAQARH
jgi:hypothetical protein